MATRLAQEGAVVGVIHYSLYPEALAPEMVAEVGTALTWTMDNIERFGGSPDKVMTSPDAWNAALTCVQTM